MLWKKEENQIKLISDQILHENQFFDQEKQIGLIFSQESRIQLISMKFSASIRKKTKPNRINFVVQTISFKLIS